MRPDDKVIDSFYDANIYQGLNALALEHGIIPTPLLRAQYYGPLELGPTKVKGVPRKDLLYAQTNDKSERISESRINLLDRIEGFFSVIEKLKEERILMVTSSGCLDVIGTYFKYLRDRGKRENLVLENKPKGKKRGKELIAKIGKGKTISGDEYTGWLNDPEYLNDDMRHTRAEIERIRQSSLDELVRNREYIAEPEFLEPYHNQRIQTEEDIKSKLRLEEYTSMIAMKGSRHFRFLLLGDAGTGKSQAAASIAEKKLEEGENAYIIPLRRLNRLRHQEITREKILQELFREYRFLDTPREYFEKNAPLIILEGLDELSSEVEGGKYSGATHFLREYCPIITTSRIEELKGRQNKDTDFTHQLSKASMLDDEFLTGYLKEKGYNEDERKGFTQTLDKIGGGVKSNIMIYFLSEIYRDGIQELTKASVYERIAEKMLFDHERTSRDQDWEEDHREKAIPKILHILGEAAYNMTFIQEPLTYESADLTKKELSHINLLFREIEGEYEFIHETWKECFAAKHLAEDSMMSEETKIRQITNNLQTISFYEFYSSMIDDSTELVERLAPRRRWYGDTLIGVLKKKIESAIADKHGEEKGLSKEHRNFNKADHGEYMNKAARAALESARKCSITLEELERREKENENRS